MATQDEIILSTEMIFEENRRYLCDLKITSSSPRCLINLENILFEAIVLFYTHRTVWTQKGFWQHYAESENSDEFAQAAYDQMIACTLVLIYNNLYFSIEGALAIYLSEHTNSGNILSLFEKIDHQLIDNYDEVKNGLKVLRCVRNSFHGNNGNYIFAYDDEIISFNGKSYAFYKDKPISLSYDFLSDFIPFLPEIYKSLFTVQIS